MKSHKYAQLFPLATAAELGDMAKDIKQRGLLHPIVLLDGQVLDGRNRLRACKMSGVEPEFIEYDGDDPLADIISWNLHRRHLSTSQKGDLAAELKPAYEAQAKERQRVGGKEKGRANLPDASKGRALDQAAAAVGVSRRLAQDAEYVRKHSPKLAAEVKAGTKTVHAAKKEVQEKHSPRDPGDIPSGIKPTPVSNDTRPLFHLKRYWKQATKKDKKSFRRWIDENKN